MHGLMRQDIFLLLPCDCISCVKAAGNISSLTNLGRGCIVLVV